MPIKFYAPLWGNTLPFATFCENVKEAGYDGVEMELPLEKAEKDKVLDVLKDHQLELIGQYYQSFEADPKENLQNYEHYLRHLMAAEPVLINCQTGKDFFDFEANARHFELAAELSAHSGIPITHETHRGKCLYAAPVAKMYFQRLPDLRICLDISHWCNVHESFLEDQREAVELAISRTDHIHSRVGHPEGPQVSDPRAPEWSEALQTHLEWWDRVVHRHLKEESILRVTTEFGPFPYMPSLAYTQMPVASQWDINVYMLNLLKQRYTN
ncbi:MAG: TIM barrel protein [Cyclobacterium sp.]|uniref:sugar phosphate isomerase/epimerase family protein n=1 Tax=unclassified Cyclobacterium TaxID=2615055 RepID=UPI0013D441A7|nr:TIM barrel protein [Cyclobacterium sp. SYSU L10401]